MSRVMCRGSYLRGDMSRGSNVETAELMEILNIYIYVCVGMCVFKCLNGFASMQCINIFFTRPYAVL